MDYQTQWLELICQKKMRKNINLTTGLNQDDNQLESDDYDPL